MATTDRLLAVMNLFTHKTPDWSVAEAAQMLGTPMSTTYRYFNSLTKSDLLTTFGGGRYVLGPAIIRYDRQLRLTDPLMTASRHEMNRISTFLGGQAVVFLCRLFGDQVMCVSQVSTGELPFSISYERGRLMPLFRGSASWVILANLPTRTIRSLYRKYAEDFGKHIGDSWVDVRNALKAVRDRGGYATVGQVDPGMRGVSVPLMLAGNVIGSLTIAGPRKGLADSSVGSLLEDLAAAAQRIERELHHLTLHGG